MSSDATAPPAANPIQDQAALRIVARRSRRIFRGLLMVILGIAGLVVLSLITRDSQAIRRCESNLQFAADEFNESRPPVLPFTLPQPTEEKRIRTHYRYDPLNVNQLANIKPVGLGHCDRAHNLFLRSPGRHVLLFDGETYRVGWMTEPEFIARAASLGFERPSDADSQQPAGGS